MDNTIAAGKLGFMRIEPSDVSDIEIASEKFIIYKFLCKTQLDYGQPKNLIFVNTQTKTEHYVPIRFLTIKNRAYVDKSLVTVCLDLNSYNRSFTDDFINDTNVAQYFLHHELIGIRNFIVYNSNVNQMNQHVVDMLSNKYGVRLNILPYNFPFALASKVKNRRIIEEDCILRTSGLTKYVTIASLNEYLYPSQKISSQSPLIKLFNRSSNEINRFELTSRAVCTDTHRKILSDNQDYSLDVKTRGFFIQKNEYPYNDKEVNDIGKKSIEIETDHVVVHNYAKCPSKVDQYPWRTTLKEKHVEFIDFISKELNKLIFL
jgi:Glycosyltransferase family 92